jgi:hypothetical protein
MVDARLTADERSSMERDGYVIRTDVFTPAEVADITAACEDLVARLICDRQLKRYKAGSYVFAPDYERHCTIKWEGDTDVVHGIEPFAHLDPVLKRWALDRRFTEPMQVFVGDENPSLFTEKLNLKRPGLGGVNPMHQDYPYWIDVAQDPTRVATAMLFLDDSTLENGCLQVAPGSHRTGQWSGRIDTDEFGSNEIDANAYKDVKLVPVPLRAGSMVMFGAYLVHCSDPNRSDKQRRALLFSYQPCGHHTMVELMQRQAEERKRARSARSGTPA